MEMTVAGTIGAPNDPALDVMNNMGAYAAEPDLKKIIPFLALVGGLWFLFGRR